MSNNEVLFQTLVVLGGCCLIARMLEWQIGKHCSARQWILANLAITAFTICLLGFASRANQQAGTLVPPETIHSIQEVRDISLKYDQLAAGASARRFMFSVFLVVWFAQFVFGVLRIPDIWMKAPTLLSKTLSQSKFYRRWR